MLHIVDFPFHPEMVRAMSPNPDSINDLENRIPIHSGAIQLLFPFWVHSFRRD